MTERNTAPASRTPVPSAAATMVASLQGHGVDRVFCVAGESYLPILDSLYATQGREDAVEVVTSRHEASAGFMALADARLTGRAGICLVSRGPGATNASIAVHAAWQEAAPLILIVGQVKRTRRSGEAFQELDCAGFFGGFSKATWVLNDPASAAALVARAFRVAESGTPGPVIIEVPEDVIGQPDPNGIPSRRTPVSETAPSAGDLAAVLALLATAERPLILAGEQLDTDEARLRLRQAADRHRIPVVTANKQQHLFDNRHPRYAGHLHNATQKPQLAAFQEADLVLAVGTRLDDTTTRGGAFPGAPVPAQPLVHVHGDPARLGAGRRTELGLACSPAAFLAALAGAPDDESAGRSAARDAAREAWSERLHRIETDKAVWQGQDAPDGIVFGDVVAALDTCTQGEATVVVDSGTFTSWVYRYLRFTGTGRLLGVTSSPMGFGVPAGVAAALRAPGHPVVVVVGDGGFLMNGSELITAVEANLPLVVIVSDNSSYATIRLHQEREFPGRAIATDLRNPDFARLAEAYGALGISVTDPAAVEDALMTALKHDGPSLLHVRTSLAHTSPYRRIDVAADGGAEPGGARGSV
ncbi:thiamine pyrophosphate-dependent enzyme [Streptomyces sp. NPDC004327]|uniref:thiamine pyrophosphate-dependent enzyme n=1 Tax=unclassified Streptomyces TaxID=2593676 RepID=UPI0036B090AB